MNVKFLRRIQVTDRPAMTFFESKIYSDPLPDGRSTQFHFVQEVKSFITSPSPGLALREPGLYEISGVAYSGTGRIAKVLVSADAARAGRKPRSTSRAAKGLHPLRHGVALGRRTRNPAEPGMGRGRQRAADPRAVRGKAGADLQAALGARVPRPPLQLDHELGGRSQG